ncbi:hypothetical protein BGZ65_008684, partial [Modicella reniformis]
GDTSLSVIVDSKTRKVIRKDFFGLFGSLEDNVRHETTTSGQTFPDPTSNASDISVYMKKNFLDQAEIPVTSIPDAVAAFGGAFSAVWGLFYFFFGAARLDPFGIITRRFIRQKTQKNLTAAYGYWTSQSVTIEPQESAPKNDSVNALSHAPLNSASDMCGEHLAVFYKKLKQLDQWTQENINQIQEQVKHQRKVEKDLEKLKGLLRDYYLEMDLASVDNPTNGNNGQWHRWIWPFGPRNSHGGDNHEISHIIINE